MGSSPPGAVVTRLRLPVAADAALLAQWRADPATEYEDWGEPRPGSPAGLPVPPVTGSGELLVTDGSGRPLGSVTWHQVLHGPNSGSVALQIGIALRPPWRGQGHGSRAQRMLADYLFATFPVHRVEASTDVANLAEQRALERAGFLREGLLRQAQWRGGAWHDLYVYSRLRCDA